MPRILAIDPGLKMGLSADGLLKALDFTPLRKRSVGDVCAELRKTIIGTIEEHEIDLVAIEEPGPRSVKSALVQFAMYGVILELVCTLDLAYLSYNVSSIKKFAHEQCHLSGWNDPIPDNVLSAKRWCWVFANHLIDIPFTSDEADAFVLRKLCEKETNGTASHTIRG